MFLETQSRVAVIEMSLHDTIITVVNVHIQTLFTFVFSFRRVYKVYL